MHAEESKKIGLRYLSPKHKFDPYKKINSLIGGINGIILNGY